MKRAASAFIFLFAVQLIAQDTPARRRAVTSPPPDMANDVEIAQINLPATASHVISVVRCTLVDTRNAPGPFGGPRMFAGETRSYVIPNGPCSGIPVALGYELIFTAIGPDSSPVHLQAWPTGGAITPALTLSRGTGSNPNDTVPRSAAVEASASGSINVMVDVGTHLLIELNTCYTPGIVVSTFVTPPLSGGGTGNVTIGIPDGAIADIKLAQITTPGKVANSATTATSANAANAIVSRDGSGNFSAGSVNLSGNLALPATTSAGTAGVITLGGNPFIHGFGTDNIFLGANAGNFTMTGISNTGSRSYALTSITPGTENTATGYQALTNATSSQNTAIGYQALTSNTTGGGNTAIGYQALDGSTGCCNTAIGPHAGSLITTGDWNIDISSVGAAADSGTIRIGSPAPHSRAFIAGTRGI